jgi:hypothetical protein
VGARVRIDPSAPNVGGESGTVLDVIGTAVEVRLDREQHVFGWACRDVVLHRDYCVPKAGLSFHVQLLGV